MKVYNFDSNASLVSQYLSEMRDVNMQNDRLRFRRNLERLGEMPIPRIRSTAVITLPLFTCGYISPKVSMCGR